MPHQKNDAEKFSSSAILDESLIQRLSLSSHFEMLPFRMAISGMHHSKREIQRLRIGYLRGPESYSLILAKRLGLAAEVGIDLDLVECIGSASIQQGLKNGDFDAVLQDSVEAYTAHLNGTSKDTVAVALIRGARNHILLSQRITRLGGTSLIGLSKLFRNRTLRCPIKIATDSMTSSTELYLLEFGQSVGNDCIEPVILPPEIMEQALHSQIIDGYCSGLQTSWARDPNSSNTSPISGIRATPERREMALLVGRTALNDSRQTWSILLTALLRAQEILSDPLKKDEISQHLTSASESIIEDVIHFISETYDTIDSNSDTDPGVISSSMRGGMIRNAPQWEVVVDARLRRLGITRDETGRGDFFDENLFAEAEKDIEARTLSPIPPLC